LANNNTTLIVFVEVDDGKQDENNEEYVVVYDLKRGTKQICQEILDINENSKYPDVSSKLYLVMMDGTQIIMRDNQRTGLKIVSLQDG